MKHSRCLTVLALAVGVLIVFDLLQVVAQPGPALRIQSLDATAVRLEWPVGHGLYSLEELTAFDGFDEWTPAPQIPRLVPPNYRMDLTPSNQARFFRLLRVVQPDPGVVPVPDTLAPLPPVNALESFADSTAFLYSGTNSVQIGVGPGVITAQRASVLRGKLKKRDGSPLAGVHVRILHHPEFGFTYTRADGMFDLGVNGGPLYTVDFQLRGYCPAQRQVQAPLQDFRCLEDVILIAADPIATPVTFGTNAPMQVAKSSVQTDKAGSRSATVLFPAGTCATLEMPDGTKQECRGLTIRATEFTVGPNGPQAMPGPLPPTSAYTYAVELSGDEATAIGASTIRFSQFVHVYVDNFLNMPTGALMPSAYYDRQLSAWVPQENGVVIKILDAVGGFALVDVDGDGEGEGSATLAAAQFTTEELQQLAANYPVGKSLWRMPIAHFTAMDFNCPQNPKSNTNPNAPGDQPNGNPNDNADGHGTVNLSSQVFEETIPLSGVPMDLHYSSARVPGYRVNAELHLPLIGGTVFTNLTKLRVDMEIAGRLQEFEYPPVANQTEDFGWDGYDAYGRLVNDTRNASFRLFYFYPQVYGGHPGLARSGVSTIGYGPPLFGNYGQFTSAIGHNEVSQAVVIDFERKLTIPDHRKLGLGGWSLTPQHRYDPIGKILYRGDGAIERPGSLVNAVSVIEPNGQTITKVAAASDGSLFLIGNNNQILRMTSSGLLASVTGNHPFSANAAPGTVIGNRGAFTQYDGMPATLVYFNTGCYGIAVGPDDSIYYRTEFEILRITPDGILHVVLGKLGVRSFDEDGTSARASLLSGSGESSGLAVGPDGTVYFADTWDLEGKRYDFLRKVAPDGRLYTLAGKGGRRGSESPPFPNQPVGFGEPAISLRTDTIRQVGVGPDGSVYFADGSYSLNRITPGGILANVLYGRPLTGIGAPHLGDKEISEGKLASGRDNPAQGNANIPAVYDFKVGADGTVYMATSQGPWFLWKIDGAGNLQRVAGKWNAPYEDAVSPLETSLGDFYDFTVDRLGAITMVSRSSSSSPTVFIRRIGPAFPGFDATELQVASRDGGELYVFNSGGLHLRTLDTLTGATKWVFTYNSLNLVTQMRDVNGLITAIERATDGTPSGIVGPYGQRTVLGVDTNGFLSSVTDPAGATATLGYGTAGLLTSIRGPRGNTFGVTYDAKGRANRLNDPNGGALQISHSFTNATDYSTVTDTAAGNHAVRDLILASNGDSIITTTAADGTRSTEVRPLSGGSVSTNASGTITTIRQTGDPRFPAQTRVLESVALDFPGGLKSSVSIGRSAGLLTPGDFLSLTSLVASVNINGQLFTDHYDATTRRLTSISPEGRRDVSDFDAAGRLTFAQDGVDAPVTSAYDGLGRLTNITEVVGADLHTRTLAYNAAGLVEQITDPLGRTVRLSYDAVGRPNQFTLPEGAVVGFEHDAEDHLTGVTPPGRPKHRFRYDSVGSLLEYTPPVVSTDDSWRYTYDLDRNLTNIVLPDGQNWNLTRGPGGRPSQVKLGSGPTLDFGYHAVTGQLTNVASSAGEGITFGYQGSLPVLTRWSGAITGAVAVEFNANLQLAAHAVNGARVAYTYDRDGLLTQAGGLAISRDAASGRVMTNTLGTVRESFAYDSQGILTNTIVTVAGTNFSRVTLRYDRLNRLTNKIETIAALTHDFYYAYDVAGRLSQVQRDGALFATYTYDANGNRLTRNAESATYDAQDRLTSYAGASFGWSRNGHRTTRTEGGLTTTYAYDLRGALNSVTLPAQQIDYVLDPLGRRIGRKVGGVLERGWLWLDQQIVAEVDASSTVIKQFIYGDDSFTPNFMIAGTNLYFLLSDERGSVRRVVNTADGSVAQALDYDEFGRVLADTNPGFQPFGYTGGLFDPATGLVRLGERDYDAETAQWTARDPIGFAGGQFSLYAYVRNDPLNFVDPAGTGPFLGFLRRNRDSAINAAFDTGPGNNDRFASALDRYDQSVQAAVLTGQVLVTTGQLINSVAPGPRGPRASFAGRALGSGSARAAGRASASRATAAAATKAATSTTSSSATTTTIISVGGRGAADLARSNPYARTAMNTVTKVVRTQPTNFRNFFDGSVDALLNFL